MKINDSNEKAKKLMVGAQQFLISQELPPIPVNYSVAYELASNRNKPLNSAIVDLKDKKQRLDNYILQDLYSTYVIDADSGIAEIIDPMSNVVKTLIDQISSSGGNTEEFTHVLEENTTRINQSISEADFKEISQNLMSAANQALEEQKLLQQQLEAAQKETEKLKQSIEKISEEAVRDELTGLLNRKGLKEKLLELLAQEQSEETSVIMMDIDHFKSVNDTYGHLLGDRVIQGTGIAINKNVRGGDIAVRYGGEEFALILPGTTEEGALVVAENIRKAVNSLRWENTRTGEKIPPITLSAGIARAKDKELIEDLILRADEALYEAKRSGRDRVHIDSKDPGVSE